MLDFGALAAKAQRAMPASETAARNDMRQESLFEYHLYTLQRPTTIADNQTKQVALLGTQGVPVTKVRFFTLSRGPAWLTL